MKHYHGKSFLGSIVSVTGLTRVGIDFDTIAARRC